MSPKELAEAIGASESSLKRWIDNGRLTATRTAGGHRRIDRSEALRFIRESNHTVVRPERLGLPDAVKQAHCDLEIITRRLSNALVQADAALAEGLVTSAYLNGQSLSAIFDGPFRRAMAEIGEQWRCENNGVLIEHRATTIAIQIVNRLRAMLPPPLDSAPVVVGGGRPGDPYLLPTMMASVALTEIGLHAVNLGPDTPIEVLCQAIEQHDASMMWISATAEVDTGRLAEEIQQLIAATAGFGVSVVVGGQAAFRGIESVDPRVAHVDTMGELVGFARGALQTQV